MNEPSFKDDFIHGVSLAPTLEEFEDSKIIVITAAGIISGVPYSLIPEEVSYNTVVPNYWRYSWKYLMLIVR